MVVGFFLGAVVRSGSLCSGFGGLDLGVQEVFPSELVWVADVDKAACAVLESRFPGVPNLGDIREVDWSTVPDVDILSAGFPCQPFSEAGKREGEADDRNVWPHVAAAVRVLRPRIVVLENDSGLPSPGLGTVLGDLAALGFDAEWGSFRASEAGAPHQRERLFVLAYAAGVDVERLLVGPHEGGSRPANGCRGGY